MDGFIVVSMGCRCVEKSCCTGDRTCRGSINSNYLCYHAYLLQSKAEYPPHAQHNISKHNRPAQRCLDYDKQRLLPLSGLWQAEHFQ